MNSIDLPRFRETVRQARIEWRRHVLERLAERSIAQSVVLDVLSSGQMIEEYRDDKPFHSALFLGYYQGKPYHVVAAYDEGNERVYVITAYEPSLQAFEPDYRTRRKQ